MERDPFVRCVAGPDAGWACRLDVGAHWLGRASGELQLFDPAVEAHHALVDVGDAGRVRLLQTCGKSPVRVDGRVTEGWADVPAGAVVEVGCSRLEFGKVAAVSGPAEWVFVPLDDTAAELERFERDVRRAASAARFRHLDERRSRTVTVGVASVRLPVGLRDASSCDVPLSALSHPLVAIVERHCRADLPLRVEVDAARPLAIVGAVAGGVVAHLLHQLDASSRARVIVVAATDVEPVAGSDRPVVVVAMSPDEVPDWCIGVLTVGETWRGTWQADIVDDPADLVRVHVAGRSPRRSMSESQPNRVPGATHQSWSEPRS